MEGGEVLGLASFLEQTIFVVDLWKRNVIKSHFFRFFGCLQPLRAL